jgi:hypothetical protein
MKLCKIDTTAKMAKLLTKVRKQGEAIEAWAERNEHLWRVVAHVHRFP